MDGKRVRTMKKSFAFPDVGALKLHLCLEQPASLFVSRGGITVFAGGHACQRRKMPPAERGTAGRELLGDRAVVLLGVQGAVLADGKVQQQVKDRARGVPKFAVAMDQRTGTGLVVLLDRVFGLTEQPRGIIRCDLLRLESLRGGTRNWWRV